MRQFTSHGTGKWSKSQLRSIGDNVIFEKGILIFHPENIEIGTNVYIGHRTILKGYFKNKITIGDNVWIGQDCFIHGGGGIIIENNVGIAPHVKLLTLEHSGKPAYSPIIDTPQLLSQIQIKEGSDIGIGAILLPGITIGKFSQIGAGAVVTRDIPPFSIAVGSPAKVIKKRE